jgi:hypothetical protein
VLPVPLLDFVNAPVPFIMGALRDTLSPAMLDPEVICVDLDNDTVSGGDNVPEIPKKEYVKLRKSIQLFADVYNPQHHTIGSYTHTQELSLFHFDRC